jgi:predicted ATPase
VAEGESREWEMIWYILKVIVVAFQVSRDSEITLNNLTLFAGGNSIGKSMVIQAILTFVQEGNSDSAVL